MTNDDDDDDDLWCRKPAPGSDAVYAAQYEHVHWRNSRLSSRQYDTRWTLPL